MNLLKIIIANVILVFLASSANASEWPKPNFQNCDFYKKTEEILNCKKQGADYLVSYGHFYCSEFNKKLNEWTGPLKKWTEDTGLCLQEMIYDNRDKRIKPCEQLVEFAFDAHPICYKQYKLCDLSIKDKFKIWSVVKLIHLAENFRRSAAQVDNVFLACMGDWLSPEENASLNRITQGTAQASLETKRSAIRLLDIAPVDSRMNRREYFQKLLPLLLFRSSSREAAIVSREYSKYYSGKMTSAELGEAKLPKACGLALKNKSSATSACDASFATAIDRLNDSDPTVEFQEKLTIPHIYEIIQAMQNRPKAM